MIDTNTIGFLIGTTWIMLAFAFVLPIWGRHESDAELVWSDLRNWWREHTNDH